jgi:hypothetical protein
MLRKVICSICPSCDRVLCTSLDKRAPSEGSQSSHKACLRDLPHSIVGSSTLLCRSS